MLNAEVQSPAMTTLAKPPSVAKQVFEKLIQAILSGDIPADSVLPSERILGQRFNVSRLMVRQAIHRLEELGLVRVRQGGATLVLDPAHCDHPEVAMLALRYGPDGRTQFKALRERQILGSLGMLLLAAREVKAEDIGELERIIADFAQDSRRLNEKFWIKIADVTGNSFYQRDTRYWFRIAREDIRVGQRAHLPLSSRVDIYRQLLVALQEGTHAVSQYFNTVVELLELLEGEYDDQS
ncbi:MAG: GntR family transcriptional regulator [Myxococcota bacterium]|jgi:DNA-binding FadR family transcriptional regulator|nr:GntR family transcriptional regulator [Myxococcota bacterium]